MYSSAPTILNTTRTGMGNRCRVGSRTTPPAAITFFTHSDWLLWVRAISMAAICDTV
jgi:hypothetical protein